MNKNSNISCKNGKRNSEEKSFASNHEPSAVPDISTEPQEEEPGINEEQMNQIKELSAVTPAKGNHVLHCLTVVGQIEGHYILPSQNKTTKYEHVIPQLVAIEEDPEIEGLIIILNTVGGDVEAGLAIAELISGRVQRFCEAHFKCVQFRPASAVQKHHSDQCVPRRFPGWILQSEHTP